MSRLRLLPIRAALAFAAGLALTDAALAQAPAPAAPAAQPAPATRVRGTIVSFAGSDLVIKANDGTVYPVKIPDNFRVTGIAKASMDDVTKGKYVGITSVKMPDGRQKAIEVHIFDQTANRNEAQLPWDLVPNSTMNNATLAEIGSKTQDGPLMTLRIKDSTVDIVVPPNIPVGAFVPGDKSLLVPGAAVFMGITKQADGTYTAAATNVGVAGMVPPM
ncbi:MAG: hypothetical protein U1E56_07000 [Bauldia sp.]